MLFVTRRLEDFAEMTFLMKLLELRMKSVRLCILSLAVLLACLTSADGHAGQPLKVFILSGQSNMQGHAHVRTIDGSPSPIAPMTTTASSLYQVG
ncbi:MAG: hypothetical protein AAGI63_11180, partial [Planctomycetota bacterium]